MSFATYTDLKDAVGDWLNREDSATLARIPDFITFAENRIFRSLRTRFNEVELLYEPPLDNPGGIVLPADFKEVKTVQYDGRMLTRKSDQWYLTRNPDSAVGLTQYFARVGNKIKWWRKPDANSDVVLWYYSQQAAISDSFIPPFYLVAPELYVFGALLEAEPFLKFKDKVSIWLAKYDEVFAAVHQDSWDSEFSGSSVSVSSVYGEGNSRYYGNDILRG